MTLEPEEAEFISWVWWLEDSKVGFTGRTVEETLCSRLQPRQTKVWYTVRKQSQLHRRVQVFSFLYKEVITFFMLQEWTMELFRGGSFKSGPRKLMVHKMSTYILVRKSSGILGRTLLLQVSIRL